MEPVSKLNKYPLRLDLTGQKFGRLTVLAREPRPGVYWRCSCECGLSTVVSRKDLRSGRIIHCGCLTVGKVPSNNRSRVTNGHDVLPKVDGRSAIARRYRDITHALLADQAGVDRCSEARQQLIRRFAAAAVLAEQMEARLANGEEINITTHATLSSTLVRLAQRIGINRIPRDVTSLSSILRETIDAPPH